MKTHPIPFVAATLALGSCAPGAPPGPPSPLASVDTVLVVDTVRVETPSAVETELEDQLARLQIQLLERDFLVEQLNAQLDATRQEVVRNLAKLQSQANRAEAASGMAEAEIAIEALASVAGGSDLPEYDEARERMAESTHEFGIENYGGAHYLATQARGIAVGGQSRLGGRSGETLAPGETLFAIPVPLQTVSRSNVRSRPDLDSEVLFTLDGDEDVEGQSHTYQWVRVVDRDGREGWIFHTLVTARVN